MLRPWLGSSSPRVPVLANGQTEKTPPAQHTFGGALAPSSRGETEQNHLEEKMFEKKKKKKKRRKKEK
jgi:hypothetical protein